MKIGICTKAGKLSKHGHIVNKFEFKFNIKNVRRYQTLLKLAYDTLHGKLSRTLDQINFLISLQQYSYIRLQPINYSLTFKKSNKKSE